jgi:hypothetical protein
VAITDPGDLVDILEWLSPADNVTGDPVSAWGSNVGSGFSWDQATAGNRPDYNAALFSGLGGIDFVSSDTLAESSFTHGVTTGGFTFSTFVSLDVATNAMLMVLENSGAVHVFWVDGSGYLNFYDGNSDTPYQFTSLGTLSTSTVYKIHFWSTGSAIRARLDGTDDTDGNTVSVNFSGYTNSILGTNFYGSYLNGQMGDVVMCDDALNSTELGDLDDWFDTRIAGGVGGAANPKGPLGMPLRGPLQRVVGP